MSSNNKRRLLSLLLVILSLAPYLSRTWCGLAETQSYLDSNGVTVECINNSGNNICNEDSDNLIDGAFYTSRVLMAADAGWARSAYFRIDLKESRLVKTFWLNLFAESPERMKDFNLSWIDVGDSTEIS